MAKKQPHSNPGTPSELRSLAEDRLKKQDLTARHSSLGTTPSPEATPEFVHELEVLHTELEMLQKEQAQSKIELKESLTMYTELYDFAPVGYLTLGRDSKIEQANLTSSRLLGVDRSSLIGMHFKQFVLPEDYCAIDTLLETVIVKSVRGNCEVRLLPPLPDQPPAHSLRTFRIEAAASETEHASLVILFSDITEQKRIDEELLESKNRFTQALEAAQAGVWQWDLKTNENIWSDELWSLYGLKKDCEKPSFKLWSDTIHPDDREITIQAVQIAADKAQKMSVEYRVCYPDSSVHWIMSRGKPLRNKQGEVNRYIGTVIDITEQKHTEESLKKQKERFKVLFDNHTSIMLVVNPLTRNIVAANLAAAKFYGWTIEERQLMQAEQISVSTVDNLLDDAKKVGTSKLNRIIRKHKRADGLIRDVEITINRIIIEGKELIYASIEDINDQQIAEKLILESNERFSSLFGHMLNGIAYCRMIFEEGRPVDFIYEQVNPSFEKITGLREVEGKRVSELIPGIHQIQPEILEIYGRVARTGQPERMELYVVPLMIWVDISVYSVQKDYFVAVFDNITERKQAEHLIVEGKSILEAALTNMSDSVIISDAKGNVTHYNDAFSTVHRFRNKEECAKTVDEYPEFLDLYLMTGELVPVDHWPVQRALRGEAGIEHQFRLLRKDSGETWFASYNYAPIRNREGCIVGSVVTARDISEGKITEEKIRDYVKQLENAMHSTLRAIAKVVEAHDPYTAGHEWRVGILARDIALEMGWCQEKSDTLHLIGLVHDIGKMSIPSEILSKPSKLSAIEFELIKTHAEHGYQILKDVKFPLPIAEIIREHHERMDGSGYPRGLKGEEILIEARIIAVADVLEAMASNRPYRPALGLDAALQEIETYRVQQFDPEVVDALLRLFREKRYQLPV